MQIDADGAGVFLGRSVLQGKIRMGVLSACMTELGLESPYSLYLDVVFGVTFDDATKHFLLV